MHPFNMDLTSTILRSIISRHEDSVLRLGAAHKPVRPQFWVQHFQMRGLYSRECSSSIYPPNEALTFFLLPLSYLRAYLIFMGQSSTLFIQFWSSLYFIPFTPPHPRRGDLCHHWQAFALKIFLLQSLHSNLVTRQNQVRFSEHAHATMLEERNTVINDVDRICIKSKLQWVDTLDNWY